MQAMKWCLNWKVVAGLVVGGAGLWLVVPQLLGAALPLLILAACPLSMLVMMAAMGKMKSDQCAPQAAHERTAPVGRDDAAPLAELKARLVRVQAERETLARAIAQLEAAAASTNHMAQPVTTPAPPQDQR